MYRLLLFENESDTVEWKPRDHCEQVIKVKNLDNNLDTHQHARTLCSRYLTFRIIRVSRT